MESIRREGLPVPAGRSLARRVVRAFGLLSIVAGVAVLAWALVVWQWNDPFTSLYTRWQQHKLADGYSALVQKEERARPVNAPVALTAAQKAALLAGDAKRLRKTAGVGDPIGRLVVPKLGLSMIVVNGTDQATLRKGPGRDARTYMPGQGELVYIAGHRTTYQAPFAHIERLKPGDPITVEMPYGTFRYVITRHSIVGADDLSVLRSHGRETLALQACHPRFFATQRYIAWAKLKSATPA